MEIKLNKAQQRAVEAPRGPLLIVAGAGTGKTRTLISRILYLIEKGINPERICAITFTNKAAGEMQERISAHFRAAHSETAGSQQPKTNNQRPYIGTFHSMGARILRRECKLLGREPNFAIFDGHDSFELVKKVVKEVFPKKFGDDGVVKKRTEKKESPAYFAEKISERKNLGASSAGGAAAGGATAGAGTGSALRMAAATERENEIAKRVFNLYEEALARNNAFDFDDLIEKPVALFNARPETLRKYQSMYDAVLVDEWQDINPKQYELVKLLAGAHRNLSVVGDDEQTIYTWRYADVKMFLNFPKEWEGAQIEFLEENYRSTKTIIEAASAVVQNNSFRTPKKLWTANADGDQISLFEAWGENDEAAWVAERIGTWKMGHGKWKDKEKKEENASSMSHIPSSQDSIAILYRTNAQSRAIEQQLLRREIPYKIYGGLKFAERREVKDAVAALRYASNSSDTISRERLEKNLTKRKFAEFKRGLERLRDNAHAGAAGAEGATADALKPADILDLFFKSFAYFEYLENNFINSDERMENIKELIKYVEEFDNLAELLEKLSLLQSTDDEAKEGGGAARASAPAAGETALFQSPISNRQSPVVLATVHLAKGLEFDTVFIVGAAEGLLPHGRSVDNESQLEEERRLMYVAMTRARKKLHISFYGMASRFINEIPEQYLQLEKSGDKVSAPRHDGAKNFARNDFYRPATDDEEFIELD